MTRDYRRELACYLGRDQLHDYDYRDPDVLEGAFEHGYTISMIAAAFDVNTSTIRRSMERHGVESPRSRGEEQSEAVKAGIEKWQARRDALREADL